MKNMKRSINLPERVQKRRKTEVNQNSPMIFYAVSYILDEISTFTLIFHGGIELNPIASWTISVNPILYSLVDFMIFFSHCAADSHLRGKGDYRNLFLFWSIAGLTRFSFFIWNVVQVIGAL